MLSSNSTGRFPPLTPTRGNLNESQKTQYEYLVEKTQKVYGDKIITKDTDEALQGPFNVLLYTPKIVEPWVNLQLAIAGLLPPIESEAAVLGVLSINKVAYGIYAHTILAQKVGYTADEVKSMLSGTCPSSISERQGAVYKLAVELAQMREPLDEELYNDAVSVLGQDGFAGVVQQSAAFVHASIMMNAMNVGLPLNVTNN